MHHLILVRELDSQACGCGRLEGAAMESYAAGFPQRRETLNRVGEIYRAVRKEFGDRMSITVLDPRNFISYMPLVIRDAVRFKVPFGTAMKALTSSSLATGVLDGQLIFTGKAPSAEEVLALIQSRLVIYRVGLPNPSDLTTDPLFRQDEQDLQDYRI
jgi:hypothetical protein